MKAINLMFLLSVGIFYSVHSTAKDTGLEEVTVFTTKPKPKSATIPISNLGLGGMGSNSNNGNGGGGGGGGGLGSAVGASSSGESSQWLLRIDCKRSDKANSQVVTFTTTNINCAQLTPQYANTLCNGQSGAAVGIPGSASYVPGSCSQQLVKGNFKNN